MSSRIIVEIRKGLATVMTKKVRLLKSHELKGKSLIEIEIRDYDIEGGAYKEDAINRGYSREIAEVKVH